MIRQMSDDDILNLFKASENYYVKNAYEKAEVERICKGDITDSERELLISKYRNIILKRAFNNQEIISTKMARSYFAYAPSELVQACSVTNAYDIEVPVIKYNDGIRVANTFRFNSTTSTKAIAEISETLAQDQDLIKIFTELLNGEINLKIRQAIENALETEVTLSANSIVEGVSKLDTRHIDSLAIILSPANYLDSSFLPRIENFKIPVYFCDTPDIYVGSLKSAIHVNFVQDQFKYDKDVKKGMLSVVNNLFSLGACIKDTSAIVRVATA